MTRIVLFLLLIISADGAAQVLWGRLTPGQHSVGFKLIRERDGDRGGRPMLVSVWYPATASTSARQLLFKDYLAAGVITPTATEPSDQEKTAAYDDFHKTLERPFISGVTIANDAYSRVLALPSAARWNLPEASGKFPAVIMSSEPESLSVTAEFLASNGFVVAAVNAPWGGTQPPDSLLWVQPTEDLQWLLNYTAKLKNIDQSKINCMGFGGGIQAAFFLTMKTDRIKALVNLEGGVFGPRSLTDKSIEYNPSAVKIPMLHIVTTGQRNEDDPVQMRALVNAKLYRAAIQHQGLRHHDFSIFGRVINKGLKLRGELSDIADQTFVGTHNLILEFLKAAAEGKADSFKIDSRFMPFVSLE